MPLLFQVILDEIPTDTMMHGSSTLFKVFAKQDISHSTSII